MIEAGEDTLGNRVIVIGGGISGLSAAYWLRREGFDVTVLEKEDRGGGCIRSERVEGYLIDQAANCLLNFLPEVDQLCQGVGVSPQMVSRSREAKFRYLVKDGSLLPVPTGVGQFTRTRLWTFRGKMRLLLEPFVPSGRLPRGPVGTGQEESVAQFVKRRLGTEILDYAVEPFVGGSFAGDVNRLCIQSTFPRLVDLEQRFGSIFLGAVIRRVLGSRTSYPTHLFSFQEGMETLPKAIIRFLGARFRPGARVTGLDTRKGEWEVTVNSGPKGDEERLFADAVVISVPAPVAAPLTGPLSGVLQGHLSGIEYAPVGVLYLGFSRRQVDHPLDGMGYMTPGKEGGFVLGSLWNSTVFPGRAPAGKVALTNYVGGVRSPGALEMEDRVLLDRTLQDLRGLLKISGEPEFVKIIRHPRALPQYTLGHRERLRKIDESLQKFPGLFLAGNYLRGLSIRDCISQGTRVARQVLGYVGHSRH